MNPEKQRIAIAVHIGYFYMDSAWHYPNGAIAEEEIPDFTSDFNAMHEAERSLTPEQWDEYVLKLNNGFIPRFDEIGGLVFAGANKRAEKFLKTIGQWEEEG